MKALIRTDASTRIGSGHVMRCLTLADGLKEQGAEVTFVCREHAGNLCDFIEKKAYKVCRLPQSSNQSTKLDWNHHAAWLGVPWEQDVHETIDAIETSGGKPDLLIVDHYALDCYWEKAFRPLVKKIMVIDDLADRSHDCDLLLDQNLYENFESRYDALVPKSCYKFLGPGYALLRPEFLEKRKKIKARTGTLEKICVFMGGADPTNETLKALNALHKIGLKNMSIYVVLTSTVQFKEEIESKFNKMPNMIFLCDVDNMAELMGDADLAIGGGGVASWERCSVMLPSIIIALAENQVEIAKNLEKAGAAIYLGRGINVSSEIIEKALLQLQASPEVINKMSQRAGSLVAGDGLSKVIKKLSNR